MIECSIIVPSYGRPKQLQGCLEALTQQDANNYEIIVVDDGSPEPLEGICAQFGSKVRCIRQDNAAQNVSLLRRLTLNMLKHESTIKVGIKTKRLRAGWDEAYLLRVLKSPI